MSSLSNRTRLTLSIVSLATVFSINGCASYCCRPTSATQSRHLYDANARWEIEVVYPASVNARINQMLKNHVKREIKTFKRDMKEAASPWQSLFYITGHRTISLDRVSYKMDSYRFTGGAHGQTVISTFVFNAESGRKLQFEELFVDDPTTWQTVSDLAISQLKTTLGSMADANLIAAGAGPQKDNFRHVVLTGDSVAVYFEHNAVAPYAAGQQRVAIPAADLSTVLHSEVL